MNYDWMPQLMILTLLFMVLLSVIGVMIKLIPQPKKEESSKPGKTTPDDLMLCLDFMLAHNIIDSKEYNKLLVKAMPFL